MKQIELHNLLESYYAMGTLKFSEWCNQAHTGRRPESYAEYIYTAEQYAWILWSESYAELDIFKVIAMLSLSELNTIKKSTRIILGDHLKQVFVLSLISEFQKKETEEAKFANYCKELACEKVGFLSGIEYTIPDERAAIAAETFSTLETLKHKIRQGVINWNITDIRRESIAEHVYSVQQLAWLMWLATDEEIDILKVVSTLSIHEVEETIIGDITPYSGITPEQKKAMGLKAVKKVLGDLNQYKFMHSLIIEFDDEETPDAFFGHLCDKLDCDLTIKKYSDGGYCSIANATDAMKNNPKIQKLIALGARTVADAFIMADRHMYTGTIFEEVINYLNTCNTCEY